MGGAVITAADLRLFETIMPDDPDAGFLFFSPQGWEFRRR